LKEAVRLEPASVRFRLDLGNLLMSTGDTLQAEREFRAAIAEDSENGEAHLRLGALLSHDGRKAEAQTHYEIAARSSDPKVRQAAVSALRRRICDRRASEQQRLKLWQKLPSAGTALTAMCHAPYGFMASLPCIFKPKINLIKAVFTMAGRVLFCGKEREV
jgi:tetratricopeptide (TPR) repeat protein